MTRVTTFVLSGFLAFVLILSSDARAQANRWTLTQQPGGNRVARVEFQGLATGIGFTCLGNSPVIALSLRRPPARSPARVTIIVDGTPLQTALVYNPNAGAWVARVADRRLIDTVVGGSAAQISIEGMNYGTASLAGSREVIGAALAGCYGLPAQMAASAPSEPRTPARASQSGRLTHGVYLPSGTSCSELEWDHEANYNPISLTVDDGNDSYASYRRVLSPTSMMVDREDDDTSGDLVQYNRCPPEQLGPDVGIWPEAQQKRVTALPITPGLYRTFSNGQPARELCDGLSEYMLFEPTRYAALVPDPARPNVTRTTITRFGAMRQVNQRVFWPETGFPLLVKGADRFEWSLLECGKFEFRRIDPRTAPATQIPRW